MALLDALPSLRLPDVTRAPATAAVSSPIAGASHGGRSGPLSPQSSLAFLKGASPTAAKASVGDAQHTPAAEQKLAESENKDRDPDDYPKPMRLQHTWDDVAAAAATASYECFVLMFLRVMVCQNPINKLCVCVCVCVCLFVCVLALTMSFG